MTSLKIMTFWVGYSLMVLLRVEMYDKNYI